MRSTRRRFLGGAGALASIGLAGCTANSDPDSTTDLEAWLVDVENAAEQVDLRDREIVDVEVGSGRGMSFEPVAILIDQDTTVRWEWSGTGGHHDVRHVDDEFRSEMTDEAGFTFEWTFTDAGTYLYSCRPHEAAGMKGAVIVED